MLGLIARDGGQRPSAVAGIEDEVAALDFDAACMLRLQAYDTKRDERQAQRIAAEVVKAVLVALGEATPEENGGT